ncbi:MAG TPA: PD-(D/E)XK nuclease family protein, partial [Acidimicrobiales bacterium]|nr:PD-(D/E)XK nuclease family protein [Acidimicrobiales bacterium]
TIIDRLPEPPSPPAVKGTLVHSALEGLFWNHPPGERDRAAAATELAVAWTALQGDPEFGQLALDPASAEEFRADAEVLMGHYFDLEDPDQVNAIGVELGMETDLDGLRLRGIIDRLDLDRDGRLVVVDYKTGRAPSARFEQGKMTGVHTYALLCQRVLGRAPDEVRLLYLRDRVTITALPSEQSIRGQRQRTTAVWQAIERACDRDDFRPRTGPLCRFCNFQAVCPAYAAQVAQKAS